VVSHRRQYASNAIRGGLLESARNLPRISGQSLVVRNIRPRAESVISSSDGQQQLANIRQIYPPEREALGVVAIGIELVDPPSPA
jgi:hypothetical protein